ncbi:MAG: LEPR-XLL domain-containing protein, partial [Pseudomonadota bacterium]
MSFPFGGKKSFFKSGRFKTADKQFPREKQFAEDWSLFRRRRVRRVALGASGFTIEALEPRYLLSADAMPFLVDMQLDGDDLSLKYDRLTESVQLYDRTSGTQIGHRLVQEMSLVRVIGTAGDDTLELDFSDGFVFPVDIEFEGGASADTLVLTGGAADSVLIGADGAGSADIDLLDDADTVRISVTETETVDDRTQADTRVFADRSNAGNTLRLSDSGTADDGAARITTGGALLDYSFDTPQMQLTVEAGDGDDTIANDGLDQQLMGKVVVQGGAGSDTLTGPPDDTTWTITGDNEGDAAGVAFVAVENLLGAVDNEDTFVVTADGSLDGVLDGNVGGFDILEFSGGTFDRVSYEAYDLHSGTIDRDGDLVRYAGLEPINDNMVVADRIISTGTLALLDANVDDRATLTDNGDGTMTLAPVVPFLTFETINFVKPTNSLTVQLSGDLGLPLISKDVLTIDGSSTAVDLTGINLTVDGEDGKDEVIFTGTVTTGDLVVNAESITVGGTLNAGAITLNALAEDDGEVIPDDDSDDGDDPFGGALDGLRIAIPEASVDLSGAAITATGAVDIDATATATIAATASDLGGVLDASLLTLLPKANILLDGTSLTAASVAADATVNVTAAFEDEADADDDDAQADAAVSVVVLVSDADVTATDSQIFSGGDVALNAATNLDITSTADGGAEGSALGATLAVTEVSADTTVDINGTTSITGNGGDGVDSITAAATLTADVETVATSTAGGAQESAGGTNQSEARLEDPNQDNDTSDQAQTSDGAVSFAGAVVVSDYRPQTQAIINTSGMLETDGALMLTAMSTDSVTAQANGSNTGSGSTGVGVAVVIGVVDTVNRASIMDQGSLTAANGITVRAEMDADATFAVEAVSGAGGGAQTGVAGSLAIHVVMNDVSALVENGSGTGLELNGSDLSVTALAATAVRTHAIPDEDGATGESLGIGASVALSILDQNTSAGIADTAVVTGGGAISLAATGTHAADTLAKGAAAGGGTTAAAVVAITTNFNDTSVFVGTGDALSAASFDAVATHSGNTSSRAVGDAEGGNTAVGLSFALTLSEETTTATLMRDMTATAGAVSLAANGTMRTRGFAAASAAGASDEGDAGDVDQGNQAQQDFATGQASDRTGESASETQSPDASTGDGSLAVAAAIAINIHSTQVLAELSDGITVTASETVDLRATGNQDAWAEATGEAADGGNGTVGAAVALNVTDADVLARTNDTDISSDGVTVLAGMDTSETALSVDTAQAVNFEYDTIFLGEDHGLSTGDEVTYAQGTGGTAIGGLTDATPYFVIEDEDGRIKLAASAQDATDGNAIDLADQGMGDEHTLTSTAPGSEAITFDPDAERFALSAEGLTLRTGDAVTYSNGGGMDIGGLENGTTYYVIADGEGGVQLAETLADAQAGEAIEITSAGMGDAHVLVDNVHRSAADATSGASGDGLGIAGSAAINVAEVEAAAELSDGVSLTLAEGTDVDTDVDPVLVSASSNTQTITVAKAAQSSEDEGATGVGASFALGVTDHMTKARVSGTAALTGAADLSVMASGSYDTETRAEGGAEGGTAVSPVVSIGVVRNVTEAIVEAGDALSLSGNLVIMASHDANTVTVASGDTKGADAAVGLALGLGIVDDEANALLERDVTTSGGVTLEATGSAVSKTTSAASAAGAAGDDETPETDEGAVDAENERQLDNANTQAADRRTSGQGSGETETPEASTGEGDSGGSLSVAAAVAINLGDALFRAELVGAVTVVAGGAVVLRAKTNADGWAAATGEAVDAGSTGIGAAVGLNVSDVDVIALTNAATITANGLTVEAGMTERSAGISVDTRQVVDTDTNTIQLAEDNGLSTGDEVTYAVGMGDTAIDGLTAGQNYFVIKGEDGKVQLAEDAMKAADGEAIDLGDQGMGDEHTLTSIEPDSEAITFDPDEDIFSLSSQNADDFRTGDALVYDNNGGGADIGGLTSGTTYFAVTDGEGSFALAESRDDAMAGETIEITSVGGPDGQRVTESIHRSAADATSGAGGGNTGIAGSVAINLGETRALSEIDGAATITMVNDGDVEVTSEASSFAGARAAAAQSEAGNVGIGASFGLTITDHLTRAAIADGATVTDANDISVSATGTYDARTDVEGGAEGGTAIAPVVALSITRNLTEAVVGTGGQLTLGGDLEVTATHEATTVTVAKGDATGSSTAVGISFGLTVAEDDVTASLSRNVDAGGGVTLLAQGFADTQTEAEASAAGAEGEDGDGDPPNDQNVNDTNQAQLDNANTQAADRRSSGEGSDQTSSPDASTSEGALTVAAAIALDFNDFEATASFSDGIVIVAGGAVSMTARGNADGNARADGSASMGDSGAVGAGVAIVKADATVTADLDNATITSGGLSVQALNYEDGGDGKSVSKAGATSGASGGGLGLAGSFALNLSNAQSLARVGQDVTYTGDDAGDVNVIAAQSAESAAIASAAQEFTGEDEEEGESQPTEGQQGQGGQTNTEQTGSTVGVGASFALNIADMGAVAEIAANAALTGAGAVNVKATGAHDAEAVAIGGASGGTAVTPVVAIAAIQNGVSAEIGSDASVSGTGDVDVAATLTADTYVNAEGSTDGTKAAVGVSIGVSVVEDTVSARIAGDVTTDGGVDVDATAFSSVRSDAATAANGAKGEDDPDGGGQSVQQNTDQQVGTANTRGGTNQSSPDTSTSSQENGGAVSVAAAIAVNVSQVSVSALIEGEDGDPANVVAGGPISVTSRANADTGAYGDGTATNKTSGTTVGAAVAVNVGLIDNIARIDEAVVSGDGVGAEALMAEREYEFEVTEREVVDTEENTIFVGDADLEVGDEVVYSNGGGTDIDGLTDTNSYFVISNKDGIIQLSETDGGDAVELGGQGSGDAHTLQVGAEDAVEFDPDESRFEVDFDAPQGLTTGDKVVYATDGAAIGGLTDGDTYYAIVDDDTLKLASSLEDAIKGEGIELTSAASDDTHTLTNASHSAVADARSGAGGGKTGVSGSVAINYTEGTTKGSYGENADVTSTGTQDARIAGEAETLILTRALPAIATSGASTGVGLSFAVAIAGHDASGVIEAGTMVDGAGNTGDLNIAARGDHAMVTLAQAGVVAGTSGGGGGGGGSATAVGGAVALSVSLNDTRAAVESSNTALTLGGGLGVDAEHDLFIQTEADADTKTMGAGSTGVGAAIGFTWAEDDTSAFLGRSTNAGGNVSVSAESAVDAKTLVTGSSQGASSTGNTADQESANQTSFVNTQSNSSLQSPQPEAEVQQGNTQAQNQTSNPGGQNNSTAQSASTQTSGSSVQVAAALGATVATPQVSAEIEDGRDLTATGDVELRALSDVDLRTETTGLALSTSGGTTVGAAVSVNVADMSTTARLGEGTHETGSLDIEAGTSQGEQNDFRTLSLAGAGSKQSTSGSGGGSGGGSSSSNNTSVAGAAGVNVILSDTKAEIAENTDVTATTGDVDLAARQITGLQNIAGGGSITLSGGTSVGAAVGVNVLDHDTQALIGAGGSVMAAGGVSASAEAELNALDFEIPLVGEDNQIDAFNQPVTNMIVGAAIGVGGGGGGGGGGSSSNDSGAGSAAITIANSNTRAILGAGTDVTAQGGDVAITASDMSTITNIVGAVGVSLEGKGIGAGLDVTVLEKTTEAAILSSTDALDPTEVTASGSILVRADSAEDIFSIAANAGIGESTAVAGSIIVMVLLTDTLAYAGHDGDEVAAPGGNVDLDAGGSVVVTADSKTETTLSAGALAGSNSSTSVGIAVTVLVDLDDTLAFIGDDAVVTALGNGAAVDVADGDFDGSGNQGTDSVRGLAIGATSYEDHFLLAVGAAGSLSSAGVAVSAVVGIAQGRTKATLGERTSVNADNTGANAGQGALIRASDATGVETLVGSAALAIGSTAVGAAISVAIVSNQVHAEALGDNQITTRSGGVTGDANSDTDIDALAISGALTVTTDSSTSASSSSTGTGGTGMGASGMGPGGGGGQGSNSSLSFAGAGSGVGNTVDNSVRATIGAGSTIDTEGAVTLEAQDESTIIADAGGVSVTVATNGNDTGAIGASVAINFVTLGIVAEIDDSTVTAGGAVTAQSTNDATIDVLTVAGGAAVSTGSSNGGSTGFGGAGSGSGNKISHDVIARIKDSEITGGSVAVQATDSSDITADAGLGALNISTGGGSGTNADIAAGAAAATNDVLGDIQAVIEDSTVTTSSGDIDMIATSTSTIDSFALAVAGSIATGGGSGNSVDIQGAGAGNGNLVENAIRSGAYRSDLDAAGAVTATASDLSTITALAGQAAFGVTADSGSGTNVGVDLGAAVSINEISNSALALLEDSNVVAGGAVTVQALSIGNIDATAFAADLSISTDSSSGTSINVNAIVAVTVNEITNTTRAEIVDTDASEDESVQAGSGVTLQAVDAGVINVNAVSATADISIGSGSGNSIGVDIQGAIAKNDISNTTRAGILGVDTMAGGSVDIDAASTKSITGNVVSAGFGVDTSSGSGTNVGVTLQAAVALNEITNTNEAIIDNAIVTSGGAVTLDAVESGAISTVIVSASVGVSIGGSGNSVGIDMGAAVATNDIDNTTRAVVEGGSDVDANGGNFRASATASGDISVNAAAVSVGFSSGSGQLDVTGNGAGAVALNEINRNVTAGIFDGSMVDATGTGEITAMDSGAISGSVTAAAASIGAGSSSVSITVALAASFAQNTTGSVTRALVDGSTLTTGGAIDITAGSSGDISVVSVAASISIGASSGTVGFTGAGAGANLINTIGNTVEAGAVNGSSVTSTGGGVDISATNSAAVSATGVAASVAVTAGSSTLSVTVAIAVALSENTITNTTRAVIDNSTAAANGVGARLDMIAQTTGAISAVAVAASVAVSAGSGTINFAGAGAGADAVNTIANTTEAGLLNGAAGTANAGSDITATDNAAVTATVISAAAAITAGSNQLAVSLAVAVALAKNDIDNTVSAKVDDSRLDAGGAVAITALSQKDIDAVNVSASVAITAGSGALSLSGAIGVTQLVNEIGGSVTALISDADTGDVQGVFSGGGLTILADNTSDIDAVGVAASVGITAGAGTLSLAFSGALTFATNMITQTTRAGIENSEVDAGGAVDIDVISSSDIDAVTVAVAISVAATGGSVGFAGAMGLASAENDISGLSEAVIDDSSVTAAGSVSVNALDGASIASDVIAAAISVGVSSSVGGGISVAVTLSENRLSGQSLARIENSTVTANGGASDVVVGADSANLIDAVAVAASISVSGSGTLALSGAGSGTDSRNVLTNTVAADVIGSTVTAGDDVRVTSDDSSTISARSVAASVGLAFSGSAAISGAVAITLTENVLNGTHRAAIAASDVTASTGSVLVTADAANQISSTGVAVSLSIAGSGGLGISAAVTGVIARNQLGNTLEASITGGSVDADTFVTVAANDSSQITATNVSVSASVGVGGTAGVGASVSVTLAENVIGSNTIATIDGTDVDAGGAVSVTADTNNVIDATSAAVGMSITASGAASVGISVAAVEAKNTTTNSTEATIKGGADVDAGGAVTIAAADGSTIDAELVAVAISVGGASSVAINIAVGLALAENKIGSDVTAGIGNATGPDGTTVDAVSVDIDATNSTNIDAIGVAVGFSGGGSGAVAVSGAGAGVKARNEISGQTEARIRAATVETSGPVTVDARDSAQIDATLVSASVALSLSGAVSVSVAVSVTLAENVLTGGATAKIDEATVNAGGLVTVDARSTGTVDVVGVAAAFALSASGGVGVSGAGAGVEAINRVGSTTAALIEDSTVSAGGPVTVNALDDSEIDATLVSASISLGLGGAAGISIAISVTLAENILTGSTIASVDNSDVDATTVTVEARSTATIETEAIAASVSVSASGGFSLSGAGTGAIARNTMNNSVEASIVGGSDVDTTGAVSITAVDQSNVTSVVVAVSAAVGISAGGAVSLAISVSEATVNYGTSTQALIDASMVTAQSGDITLRALSTGLMDVDAAAAAISVTAATGFSLSGAGVGAIARVNSTSLTEAAIRNGSDVDAQQGAILIDADDNRTLDTDVVGVAISVVISGGFAGGGAVTVTEIDNDYDGKVRAAIDGSDADASGTVQVLADATTSVAADAFGLSLSLSVGSVSGSFGVTAGVVNSDIGQTVEARIVDADVSGSSVSVLAEDHITATAVARALSIGLAVGLGGGSVSIAAAVSNLRLNGATRAFIDGSEVTANSGAVTVDARSTSDLENKPWAFSVAATVALGGFAVAGAGVSGITTVTQEVTARIGDESEVTAGTSVTVKALDDLTSEVELISVALAGAPTGAAAIGVGIGENRITSDVSATVEDSDVTAQNGTIAIDADSTHLPGDITSRVTVVAAAVAIGGVAGAGGRSIVDIDNTVEAGASGSDLTASGAVTVDADSQHYAEPYIFGLAGSTGISVAATVAEANIGGATRAYVDGESTISSAGALNVTADSAAFATPSGESIAVGLGVGVALAEFSAHIDRETAAYVGTRTGEVATGQGTVDLGNQQLNIRSNANLQAVADNFAGGFGLLAGASASRSTAIVEGTTLAYIGEGQMVEAGGVEITANSTDNAEARNDVISAAAGVTASLSETIARVSSRTEAYAGAGADFVAATVPMGIDVGSGAVVIDANATMTATAESRGGGFAGIANLTLFRPYASVDGAVRAYLRDGVDVTAGSLSVTAGDEPDEVNMTAYARGFAVGVSFGVVVQDIAPTAVTNGVVEAYLGSATDR